MQEYGKDRLFDIMDTTQMNYANMVKRLTLKKKFSNFMLIYYSIFLIIYSLTSKFYPQYFEVELSSYFGIIISIIVLVYSLINSSANYSERISSAGLVLNRVKDIKRELTDENYIDKKKEYDVVMRSAEYRDDLDFFRTLKQKCREEDINCFCYKQDIKKKREPCTLQIEKSNNHLEKLNNHLSEVNPLMQQIKIYIGYLFYSFLILVPIIIFILCIVVRI